LFTLVLINTYKENNILLNNIIYKIVKYKLLINFYKFKYLKFIILLKKKFYFKRCLFLIFNLKIYLLL
jgi:hypothetical protein